MGCISCSLQWNCWEGSNQYQATKAKSNAGNSTWYSADTETWELMPQLFALLIALYSASPLLRANRPLHPPREDRETIWPLNRSIFFINRHFIKHIIIVNYILCLVQMSDTVQNLLSLAYQFDNGSKRWAVISKTAITLETVYSVSVYDNVVFCFSTDRSNWQITDTSTFTLNRVCRHDSETINNCSTKTINSKNKF